MTDRFHLAALDPAEAIDELFALWRTAYTQEAEALGLKPERFPPLQAGPRDLAMGSDTWLAAWAQGELAGALAWGADDEDPRAQRISSLIVAPAWQRQGVATRLLHALLALTRGSPLTVHTAAANEGALALYEQTGFRQVHRWLSAEGIRRVRLQRPAQRF